MRSDKRRTGEDIARQQAARLRERLEALAWLLDSSIRLPGGFRIGLDPLLGLVPVVGDALGVLLSGYLVVQAARLGEPRSVLLRMVLNVAVEGMAGVVPIAGDLFDAAWKANQRNVVLLNRHLDNPAGTARSSRLLVGGLIALVVLAVGLLGVLTVLLLVWLAGALG